MEKVIFFTSSVGDTDLATETIKKLPLSYQIFLVPLTTTASDRIKSFQQNNVIIHCPFELSTLNKLTLSNEELKSILQFVNHQEIERAYIGVPSPVKEGKAFQIAEKLKIPLTIAYEYMFDAPDGHSFWEHIPSLVNKEAHFAVPFAQAKLKIESIDKNAIIDYVGHLSIDRVFSRKISLDQTTETRKQLSISEDEKLVVISSTTQPINVDNNFFAALLEELSKPQHKNIKLFISVHPGIQNLESYLNTVLETCNVYPQLHTQFKFVLNKQNLEKLDPESLLLKSPFILMENLSGAQLADTADCVGQAVPGALLNEAALRGKPAYYHDRTKPSYLDAQLFSENLNGFFTQPKKEPISLLELGLTEQDTPARLALLIGR